MSKIRITEPGTYMVSGCLIYFKIGDEVDLGPTGSVHMIDRDKFPYPASAGHAFDPMDSRPGGGSRYTGRFKVKKKVIALVVDTELTNEQIERAKIMLTVDHDPGGGLDDVVVKARNVRVLDSD